MTRQHFMMLFRDRKKKYRLNGHTSILIQNINDGSILHLKVHSNFIPISHLFLLISILSSLFFDEACEQKLNVNNMLIGFWIAAFISFRKHYDMVPSWYYQRDR